MNKRILNLSCCCLTALLAGLSSFPALSSEHRYTVIGRPSCSDWISARRRAAVGAGLDVFADLSPKFWALGYLSALNGLFAGKPDLLREIDADTIYDWLDQFCAKNPSDNVGDATAQLFLELQKISK